MTQVYLKTLLDYCPETGKLFWKEERLGKCEVGQEAGRAEKKFGYHKNHGK